MGPSTSSTVLLTCKAMEVHDVYILDWPLSSAGLPVLLVFTLLS